MKERGGQLIDFMKHELTGYSRETIARIRGEKIAELFNKLAECDLDMQATALNALEPKLNGLGLSFLNQINGWLVAVGRVQIGHRC